MATEDYAALALKKRDEFYAKIADTHAWKNVSEEATYSVRHRKVDNLDIVLMKGTASTPAEHLARLWHAESPMVKSVDKNIDHIDVLKVVDKHTLIVRHVMKPQLGGVISARDTVGILRYEHLPNGGYEAILFSIDYPECPKKKPFKRARNEVMGLVNTPKGDGKSSDQLALFHSDMRFKKVAKPIADSFATKVCEEYIKAFQNLPAYDAAALANLKGLTGWFP